MTPARRESLIRDVIAYRELGSRWARYTAKADKASVHAHEEHAALFIARAEAAAELLKKIGVRVP
jgi:hypothetical protein